MRFIKLAGIGLVVLFGLLTAIGLLMPDSVTVLRSIEINAPVDSVRHYTHDLAQWRQWLNGADTATYKQLTPATNEKNSQVLLGTFTITVVDTDPKYIVTLWRGERLREQISRLDLYPEASGATAINWSFQQQLSWYPWERLSDMLYDKVFGPNMEAGLSRLKNLCEEPH